MRPVHGLLALLVLSSACASDFDPASRITRPRLLAARADSPYAEPGQRVAIEALVAAPDDAPLALAFGTCTSPRSGSALDCLRSADLGAITPVDAPLVSLEVPDDAGPFLGVVVVACPGTLTLHALDGLPVTCTGEGGRVLSYGELEVGVKRIFVGDPALNHNPDIQGVTLDGTPWEEGEPLRARCKTEREGVCDAYASLRVTVEADGASERGVDAQGVAFREQAVVQLYATGGTFDDDVRLASDATTRWRPRPEDAGSTVRFWFVVRDDRGGVSWVTRQLDVP
jgi:hypothetical protein